LKSTGILKSRHSLGSATRHAERMMLSIGVRLLGRLRFGRQTSKILGTRSPDFVPQTPGQIARAWLPLQATVAAAGPVPSGRWGLSIRCNHGRLSRPATKRAPVTPSGEGE
jgi:hypothetical protein